MPAKKRSKPKAAKRKNSASHRNRVAGGQEYEVAYVAKKMSVTAAAVKAAIKKVGNMRKDVEAELKKKK
jgi:hypothetical protein